MADEKSTATPSPPKSPAWGAYVVIVFGLAVLRFHKAADVATAVGAVSGVIAALVGAYFGVRGATLAQTTAAGVAQSTAGGDGTGASRSPGSSGGGGSTAGGGPPAGHQPAP